MYGKYTNDLVSLMKLGRNDDCDYGYPFLPPPRVDVFDDYDVDGSRIHSPLIGSACPLTKKLK